MTVTYLNRAQWGANPVVPQRGHTHKDGVPVVQLKTDLIIHHTVIVDNDITKNVWETLDEVKTQMQRLQVIRPDLGSEVPYNEVWFLMSNFSLTACEGRGVDRTGAHTKGFNTIGMGVAFQADLHNHGLPYPFERWLPSIAERIDQLKREIPNLAQAGGHRDYPGQSTACPGQNLYPAPMTEIIRLVRAPLLEEEDVTLAEENRQRDNKAAVLLKLAAIAQADSIATQEEKNWGKLVVESLRIS